MIRPISNLRGTTLPRSLGMWRVFPVNAPNAFSNWLPMIGIDESWWSRFIRILRMTGLRQQELLIQSLRRVYHGTQFDTNLLVYFGVTSSSVFRVVKSETWRLNSKGAGSIAAIRLFLFSNNTNGSPTIGYSEKKSVLSFESTIQTSMKSVFLALLLSNEIIWIDVVAAINNWDGYSQSLNLFLAKLEDRGQLFTRHRRRVGSSEN